jgi:hypothetical protein
VTLVDSLALKQPWVGGANTVLSSSSVQFDPISDELVTVLTGLQDQATIAHTGVVLGVVQYIQPGDAATAVLIKAGAKDVSAVTELALDYDVYVNQVGNAIDLLSPSQSATVDLCKPADTELPLTDIAISTLGSNRAASSSVALEHSVAVFVAGSPYLYQYHPFVGEGGAGAPSPPPATLPTSLEGITAPFQLVYPATGAVTDSVTLRAPNLGNKERLSFNRVLRETRGGTLVIYADPIWPKIQTLVLTFSGLTQDEAEALLTFLDNYLGQEIGLIDWEQRYWRGVVMTPEEPITEDSRGRFSASLQFEGELDASWSPANL